MSSQTNYYAVARGKVPGVYTTWDVAKKQIDNFKGARYKKFSTRAEADIFVATHSRVVHTQKKIEDFFGTVRPSDSGGLDESPMLSVDPVETEKTLIVFTDGACSANGRKSAKASYAVAWPYHPEMNHAERLDDQLQTNNRGETLAVIHAIRQADSLDPFRKKTLIVYTDSQFLINSVTKWMPAWKRKNWKKADGEPVANLDLVKILDDLVGKRKITFIHVRAHTGGTDWQSRYNDIVDKLARSALGDKN